jgi:hypothetical protein
MNTQHLTEEEIQQYALDNSGSYYIAAEHIHSCGQCKEKAETYRLLFRGIQLQNQPAFDFDLTELVMAQLPAPASKDTKENFLIYFFIIAAIAVAGLVSYFFRAYVALLFRSIAPVLAYLFITAFITLSIGLILDMYKNYKKKIHLLDVYPG